MKSIRRQLTLGLLAGFAVLLGAGGLTIYFLGRSALYREFDSGLMAKARSLVSSAKPEYEHGRMKFEVTRRLQGAPGSGNPFEFCQLFTNGATLARSSGLKNTNFPQRFGTPAEPVFWDLTLPNGEQGRALGARFTVDPKVEHPAPGAPPPPPIVVGLVLAADCSHLDETLGHLALIVLGVGVLTLALGGTWVAILLGRELAPLRRLVQQAEGIDAASLGSRFSSERLPSELAPIVHRLNDLLSRLDDSFQRERRFSADLAHELRTPIAALRTISEVSVKWSEGGDVESFKAVQEIAEEMQSMITRLLALARSEQKTIPIESQPVFVASVVEALWQPHQEKAVRKKLAVQLAVPVEARLETDPTLLRGILLNLINNAVDYTPPRGSIRIAFQEAAGRFTLAVTNTVNNLEPADLPNLFQRFWRKDKARSDGDHTGLGLSLVKSFAELLGCKLAASLDNAGGELTMTLCGPARMAQEAATSPPGTSSSADKEIMESVPSSLPSTA